MAPPVLTDPPPASSRVAHQAPRPATTWELRGPGMGAGSRWGYDDVLECWWAEVVTEDGRAARVGADHLVATVDGLARALAWQLSRPPDDLYLALTAR